MGWAAKLRRWRGVDGQWSTLFVLAVVLAAGLLWLVVFATKGAVTTLTAVVVSVVALWLVSGRFGRGTLRAVTTVLVVLAIAALVVTGRDEFDDDVLSDGRSAATERSIEVAELASRGGGGVDAEPTPTRKAAMDALDALRQLAGDASGTPVDPATTLETVIAALQQAFQSGDRQQLEEAEAKVAALRAQALLADAGTDPDSTLRSDLQSAIVAITAYLDAPDGVTTPAADDLATARAAAVAAIADLCASAGGNQLAIVDSTALRCAPLAPGAHATATTSTTAATTTTAASAAVPQSRAVATAVALADLRVAELRAAVAGDKADAAAVDTALAAYAATAADDDAASTSFVDALTAGADRATSAPLGNGTDESTVPLALTVVGWALLGGVALLAYRLLEIRAGRGQLGPVEFAGAAADDRFKSYVLRNIPEPSAVPGSSSLQTLTDLVAAAEANPAATWLGKVVAAFLKVLDTKPGYLVSAVAIAPGTVVAEAVVTKAGGSESVEVAATVGEDAKDGKDGKPKDEATIVVVRVSSRRTGAVLGHTSFGAPDTDPVRVAAYWAAAFIIDLSDQVPAWLRWEPEAAASVAAFYQDSDTPGPVEIEVLQRALDASPRSGQLGLELAYRYSLVGEHLEAFALELRLATLYGQFEVVRYRMAIAAAFLASDIPGQWRNASDQDREVVVAAIRRYARTVTRCSPAAETAAATLADLDRSSEAMRSALCIWAAAELDDLLETTTWAHLLWRGLRRSQRGHALSLIRRTDQHPSSPLERFHAMVETCNYTVRLRRSVVLPAARPTILAAADGPDVFWQVTYNCACFFALLHARNGDADDAATAFDLLERSIEQSGGHQLTAGWANADPDLQSLRDSPRFDRFVGMLPPEEDRP